MKPLLELFVQSTVNAYRAFIALAKKAVIVISTLTLVDLVFDLFLGIRAIVCIVALSPVILFLVWFSALFVALWTISVSLTLLSVGYSSVCAWILTRRLLSSRWLFRKDLLCPT